MTRAGAGALVALALAAGLVLRLARLETRPMHHDEANQAIKFGLLLEHGEYRYDARDHHGPTLYYLTLPAAWLRGQTTLASLDERTLRGVTAIFGAATILLLPLLSPWIGRTALVASAWLLALSPAMVFYSRMFIQESLFVCFALAFVIAIGRVTTGGGLAWSAMAGVAAGLAVATKETSVIVLPAALVSCAVAWWSLVPWKRDVLHKSRSAAPGWQGARSEHSGAIRATSNAASRDAPPANYARDPASRGLGHAQPPTPLAGRRWARTVLVSLTAAASVAALFYSSFLAAPGGVLEPFRAVGPYFDRGVVPASHAHPWHYYVDLLVYSSAGGLRWSEGLVLALAMVGAVAAWGRPDWSRPERAFLARYLTCHVALAAAIFSAIPYKTPWNLLPFYAGAIVLAGIGASTLVQAMASRTARGVLAIALVLASGHLGWQAWRASVTYAADARNPYVYAPTVPDAVRMATRIRDLAGEHPDGPGMLVSVIAPPHEQWPLPWYLRAMPHVGYWLTPSDALALHAPVVVASMEHTAALDASLGDRYVSEFYGLRPEVLLALYVERGLWERFLSRTAGDTAAACRGAGLAAAERCGRAPAVSLWRTPSVR